MVNSKKGTVDENPSLGSSNDKSLEQVSGEPGTVSPKSQGRTDAKFDAPFQDRASDALIQALRIVVSSAVRTIGPPLGLNEHLAGTLRRFHALLGKLARKSDREFIEALETLANGQERPHTADPVKLDPKPLCDLSLGEIECMISDPKITKQRLLAIVRERFGGFTGTLGKLNHDALLERVAALAMNERSHETVARLASGSASQHSSEANNAAAAAQIHSPRESPSVEEQNGADRRRPPAHRTSANAGRLSD
jgi:hypothetical protein